MRSADVKAKLVRVLQQPVIVPQRREVWNGFGSLLGQLEDPFR